MYEVSEGFEDWMVVFQLPHNGEWTWDCTGCNTGGDFSPDRENAEYEADQHYIMKHTDLHPWEVPC